MLLGCIADDLTGATDLGVTLAREGLSVVQVNGYDPADPATVPTPEEQKEAPATPTDPEGLAEDFHEEFSAVGTGVPAPISASCCSAVSSAART